MNPKPSRRRTVIVLTVLAVIALAIWAAVSIVGPQITSTDEVVEVELVSPAPAPPGAH